VVFLAAAATKLTALPAFEERVVLRVGLPREVTLPTARFLPWLELTCGLCLALGWAVREAALLTGLLLFLFLAYPLHGAGDGDCGCFVVPGMQDAPEWWPAVRNVVLLLCSVRVAWDWQDQPAS
jgi:uncharacterized membrane protein YphA (DoxX/SURF4 family)